MVGLLCTRYNVRRAMAHSGVCIACASVGAVANRTGINSAHQAPGQSRRRERILCVTASNSGHASPRVCGGGPSWYLRVFGVSETIPLAAALQTKRIRKQHNAPSNHIDGNSGRGVFDATQGQH